MEEDCIGSQGPRWTVTLEVQKKKEKKIKLETLEITCTEKRCLRCLETRWRSQVLDGKKTNQSPDSISGLSLRTCTE
jgi:hypothetical protein